MEVGLVSMLKFGTMEWVRTAATVRARTASRRIEVRNCMIVGSVRMLE